MAQDASVKINGGIGVNLANTITAGGTAQNLFGGNVPKNGYCIINTGTGDLYVSEGGTPTIGGAFPKVSPGGIASSQVTESFSNAQVFKIIGATTGQTFIEKYW